MFNGSRMLSVLNLYSIDVVHLSIKYSNFNISTSFTLNL
jgi:hypothetical protein